ncbi:MAG: Glu-tRNA(Gln) amidotransferase GatDE subunit D [Euryarchaeota archaeon]|nr:Glu-tRNA(Gln) amidotransferase GatDE subunit D [Euryarchaeota archaeon]
MAHSPDVGSRVRIKLTTHDGETEIEGVVLPPAVQDYVTIKLANGYNVSHPLTSVEIISSEQPESSEVASTNETETNPDLPTVRIIHTGGTIASKVDYKTGAVTAQFEPSELVEHVPELLQITNLDVHKIGNMFSEDIRPNHWNQIIDATEKAFADGCTGVVVTHGTDTLHITASAVAFAWCGKGGNPPGRIAFVGSQRSSDRASSDAAQNLISAVKWAAEGPLPTGELSDAVVVSMHKTSDDGACSIHSATGVRKLHSSRRDAFRPVNTMPLATIRIDNKDVELELEHHYKEARSNTVSRASTSTAERYDENIVVRQMIAGPWLTKQEIDDAVASNVDALVIHGTGLGHLPIENPNGDAPQNIELQSSLQQLNIPALVVNQCIHGPINMNVYSKGRIQQDIGLLGHGITSSPEAAVVKLHFALSNNMDVGSVMTQNLIGEQQQTILN